MSMSSPWGGTPTSPTSNTVRAALTPFCFCLFNITPPMIPMFFNSNSMVSAVPGDNVEGSTGDVTELNEPELDVSGSATKQLKEKL